MLVLRRREGESIVIDGRITVRFLGLTSRGHVRLGIEAPRDVVVNREEIHRACSQGSWYRREDLDVPGGES